MKRPLAPLVPASCWVALAAACLGLGGAAHAGILHSVTWSQTVQGVELTLTGTDTNADGIADIGGGTCQDTLPTHVDQTIACPAGLIGAAGFASGSSYNVSVTLPLFSLRQATTGGIINFHTVATLGGSASIQGDADSATANQGVDGMLTVKVARHVLSGLNASKLAPAPTTGASAPERRPSRRADGLLLCAGSRPLLHRGLLWLDPRHAHLHRPDQQVRAPPDPDRRRDGQPRPHEPRRHRDPGCAVEDQRRRPARAAPNRRVHDARARVLARAVPGPAPRRGRRGPRRLRALGGTSRFAPLPTSTLTTKGFLDLRPWADFSHVWLVAPSRVSTASFAALRMSYLVPEASAALLLGAGAAGLARLGTRRRAAGRG